MIDEKNIYRTYIKFLLPTLGSMVLFSSYTMIDGIFVGQGVGPDGLAAVNVSLPFVAIMFALAMLISIGTSNMITYELGKENLKRAKEYFSKGLAIAAVLSFSIAFLSYLNIDKILLLLGADESIYEFARSYLGIIMLFSPFFALTYVFEIFIKADGYPRLAIFLTMISAITNIVLDYVFIFILDLGLKGAAIATGLAQLLPTIGYMIHFLSDQATLKFVPFRISSAYIKDMVRFGIPSSLTELSSGFTVLLFNRTIYEYFGVAALASFSIIVYLKNLIINTMLAISQSGQPLISYSYGAKDFASVKKLRRLIMLSILIAGVLAFSLIQVFPSQIINIFMHDVDPQFMSFTISAMKKFSIAFLIIGFNIGIGGYLTAVHKPNYELIISILRGYVLVYLVLEIVPKVFGPDLVWHCLTISELLSLACAIYLLYLRLLSIKKEKAKEMGKNQNK